jgi:hypothetical protein
VDYCPVRSIREVKPDGTDVYLGDIYVDRCANKEMNDDNEDKEIDLINVNMAKLSGDPTIVWTVGGATQNSNIVMPYKSRDLQIILPLVTTAKES